jgi:hypothetical protein
MATIVVTNLSTSAVFLPDFYVTLGASGQKNASVGQTDTFTTTKAEASLSLMTDLMTKVQAGTVSVAVTPSVGEAANPLLVPPNAVQAVDMAAVAATAQEAGTVVIRKVFTAGTPGTPDDVTIYAAAAVPFKMRILDCFVIKTTAIDTKTITLYPQAAAGGTAISSAMTSSGASAQLLRNSLTTASQVIATTDGLFARRSDRGEAGELIILARRES